MYSSTDNGSAYMRQSEMARQSAQKNAINQINSTFDTNFNDKFYQDRAKAYEAYAAPELSSQYRQSRDNLAYDLARKGLTLSSAGVRAGSSLDRELAKKRAEMVDIGQSQANDLRTQVESTRANLVNQAIGGADPSTAAAGALAASTQYKAPTSFGSIGNLFDDWSKIYAARQTSNAYNNNSGWNTQPAQFGAVGNSGYMVGGK